MNKNIAVLTTNRSEYGLLRTIIMKLQVMESIKTNVLVSGSHLVKEWGYTYNEILNDKISNLFKIAIINQKNIGNVSAIMACAINAFSLHFSKHEYDMLIVLGDRYETMAVCIAAINNHIPIAHLHGGEISEGALDDYYRHCITKMSYLHFTSVSDYMKRVIQLGEDPCRVFCVGAIGVENVLNMKLMNKMELENNLHFKLDKPYAVVTYHPTSIEKDSYYDQLNEIIEVIKNRTEMSFIVTYANTDMGGREINDQLEKSVRDLQNVLLIKSLGILRYLSAVKYSSMVIGNSSSGILEVPSFHIPTINIGDRQKGRVRAETVIDCKPNRLKINEAINKALCLKEDIRFYDIKNPYEGYHTSERIVETICNALDNEIVLSKKFYDLY